MGRQDRRSARPEWERAATAMRHATTSVVAAVAACALAVGLRVYGTPADQAEASSDDGEREARAGYDAEGQTVDASDSATAAGVRETHGHVFVTGDADLGTTPEFAELTQAIADFEAKGYTLSLTLVDLDTGRSLEYQADDYYYSASSIKGPFVASGYEMLVDTGEVEASVVDPIAERTLVLSDNDAYLELRDLFGSDAFATWLEAAGVDAGYYASVQELADTHYPHLSTNQMAAMWRHLYPYLSSDGTSARKIVSYLRRRQVSPIKEALGDAFDTWSKAGWIDFSAEGGVEPATWDAGVVLSPEGSYVLAAASDAPADLDALVPVVVAANSVHAALVAR